MTKHSPLPISETAIALNILNINLEHYWYRVLKVQTLFKIRMRNNRIDTHIQNKIKIFCKTTGSCQKFSYKWYA